VRVQRRRSCGAVDAAPVDQRMACTRRLEASDRRRFQLLPILTVSARDEKVFRGRDVEVVNAINVSYTL
jgi:hypothetical protein